jgi:methylglyoxal reductase
MIATTIGKSALKISVLGLGTWAFAADGFWGEQDEQDSQTTIRAALDCGINLIDTAEAYGSGRSEEIVGRALKGVREKAVIATKVSSTLQGRTSEYKLLCDYSFDWVTPILFLARHACTGGLG